MKYEGAEGPHQEITGGTQRNVVFARDIQTVEIHGEYEIHSAAGDGRGAPRYRSLDQAGRLAVGLVGALLLLTRPALPLPERIGLGPVACGWLLVVGAIALEAGTRARRVAARRRRAAWRSEKSLARTAEALAESLASRYDQDERLARINDPHPLAVSWTTEPGGTPADGDGLVRQAEGDDPPRGAGPTDGEAAIVGLFTSTPSRRLVVLGGAGAGKSVLVLRLAHALLRERTRGSGVPVPAVVSLASWDPGHGLLGWLAERLVEEHPNAFAPIAGAPPADVAFHLLLTRRVLPVLDGFDELPEHRRAEALRQITATMRGRRPFVLTSREPEYREHAPEEGLFERTEIRLSPLNDEAVRSYLAPARTRNGWTPVLDRLDERAGPADAPPEVRWLREVLSVPLMVGLARVAYAHRDSDPQELLEPGRFDDRQDIERHLYDAFLDVVYSASHDIQAARGGWAPERARAWAGFLAARMKETNEQDFAWWRLDETVPRAVRVLALAPACALGAVLVAGTDFGPPLWHRWLPLGIPGAFVLLCGLVLTALLFTSPAVWQLPPRRPARPGGTEIRAEIRAARWKAGFATLGLAAGWAAALTADSNAPRWAMGLPTASVVWACATRATALFWRRSDPAKSDSPAGLLRADRRGVLTLGWSAPVRRGMVDTPLGLLVLPVVMLAGWQQFGGVDTVTDRDWVRLSVGLPLAWTLYAFGASAWGGFTVARLYLWGTGRLPRHLMAFLEDAHARGVLRQSGGVYRFRHIELRDRLARDADGGMSALTRSRPRHAVLRRVSRALLTGTAGLAVVAVWCGGFSATPLPGPVRSLPDVCGLLARQDLDRLMEDPAVVADGDGRTCRAGEQAPFARDTRITIGARLVTGKGYWESGPHKAHTEYVKMRSYSKSWAEIDWFGGFHHALSGLGDEAYISAKPNRYRDTSEVQAANGFALVGMRTRNALLYVWYYEEFASLDRVAEAAQILAREAARRAGLAGGASHTEGATSDTAGTPVSERSMANLPSRTKTPERGSRFAYYSRRPALSVRGATWHGDERSYIWYLREAPIVFRAPKNLDCTRAKDVDDPVTYTCTAHPEPVRAGLLPDIRLDVRFHFCGESCDQKETDAFLRASPDHARTSWTKVDHSTYVAAGPVDGADRYRIAMKQYWDWRDEKTKTLHANLLWVRAEVPQEHAATAQKIVNDLFTQTAD
ncbi:NACHT domain-containing protein [Streptomyces sp. NPDC052042]|uniref:NACHT domain-containing protein n=1 Tax=Streptomyces sp. NPDC052042 TaxID=3365683 RepID=UPI0037CFA0DC